MHGIIYQHIGQTGLGWIDRQQSPVFRRGKSGNLNVLVENFNTFVLKWLNSALIYIYTHTHPFNCPFSRTAWVGRYQKGKTNLDFTEARDSE